ncbi:related to Cell division control protein 50 [Saccharomycodes ludwigii]|uniref:Related to Cell division control protein 50 n=1 Tax=Saccharomycodes ludwigii TaxID=36035 RepID=A0A376B2M7_9ASCO|nr:related to Cell division control protein 50 [Saccharomycodes ludwigii]
MKFNILKLFLESNERIDENGNKIRTNRPPNTAFRQQRLKSWQPILSPQSMIPFLAIIAMIFAPIGVAFLVSALNVQNFVIDYSHCDTLASTDDFQVISSKLYHYNFKQKNVIQPSWKLQSADDNSKTCQIKFSVPNNIKSPLYVYYQLTNFYQNHRKYVQSYDADQLKGVAVSLDELDDNCKPLKSASDTEDKGDEKIIYPCGLIANSLFNDTFSTVFENVDDDGNNNSTKNYNLTNKNIAWKSDRKLFKKTQYNASQIIPPPNWAVKYPDGYVEGNIPDISTWEEFQVWMRTAGLPTFYKLVMKNEKDTLHKGVYTIDIGLNYPVEIFGGKKSLVITTNSIIGGRNLSLGIVYIIVAGVCIIFGIIFLLKVIIKPRKLGDHSYLNFDDGLENSSEQADKLNQQLTPLREIM